MEFPKLTKEAIRRLNESPIDVKLWNGCFNVATAKAEFSRHYFELRVEVTHPYLTWQCGDHSEVVLYMWKSSEGHRYDIPEELFPLVEKMRQLATMSDEDARSLSDENHKLFSQGMREMGFTFYAS